MSDEHPHQTEYKFLSGLLLGGILGALIIFFLGTKEGKKAGNILRKKGEDFIDDLEEKVEDLEDRGKEIIKEGNQLKKKVLAGIEDKKDDLTKTVAHQAVSTLEKIEDVQKEGLTATRSLKRHFDNLPSRS